MQSHPPLTLLSLQKLTLVLLRSLQAERMARGPFLSSRQGPPASASRRPGSIRADRTPLRTGCALPSTAVASVRQRGVLRSCFPHLQNRGDDARLTGVLRVKWAHLHGAFGTRQVFTEKEGGGGEVKRFCRERAGGTKTCGRDEYGLGGAVGLDLARRFSLRAFSCNI